MDKRTRFKNLLDSTEARKLLKKHGFKDAAISHYALGRRIPEYATAVKISRILKVPLRNIPWKKIIYGYKR